MSCSVLINAVRGVSNTVCVCTDVCAYMYETLQVRSGKTHILQRMCAFHKLDFVNSTYESLKHIPKLLSCGFLSVQNVATIQNV